MYILLFFSYAFAVWYLFRVSKGVRELPGNLQSATSTVPSGKALMYFGLLLATGVFFVFISFTMFLPVMVLMPQKFAICFTLGCGFIIGSFFALRGPSNQLAHMSSKEVYLLYYIPMVYFCNMVFDGLTDYQLNINMLSDTFSVWYFCYLSRDFLWHWDL